MNLKLTYGILPTRGEFNAAFHEHVTESKYQITHGSPSRDGEDRPPAGFYTRWELWDEINRLNDIGDDACLTWVSNILYSLGIEWI